MRLRLIVAALAAAATLVAGGTTVAAAHQGRDGVVDRAAHAGHASRPHDLAALRSATAAFHSIAAAEQHGYALLTDVQGIACIDMPGMGGMGVHWANSGLVADPAIDAQHPEALVYAPSRNGTLRLAAIEYVVVKAAWDAKHSAPPRLFGHVFNLTESPNRFGLPAYYSLHVWAWQHNPAGTFEMFNPRVSCH